MIWLFASFVSCQSLALAQERERELSERDDLICVLTQTRDQALATLQRHGLAIPTQIPNKEELETLHTHVRMMLTVFRTCLLRRESKP